MAEENKNQEQAKAVPAATTKAKMKVESIYSVEDFIESKIFKCAPECIVVAFKEKGIKEATLSEGKKIVNDFLNREVK